jgi:hypothetical protein
MHGLSYSAIYKPSHPCHSLTRSTNRYSINVLLLHAETCYHKDIHISYPHLSSLFHYPFSHPVASLLEDLSVCPLVRLALDLNGLVPRPLVVDKGLVLGLFWVKFGELVALKVGSDVECLDSILSADDESALDDGVVGFAVDRCGAEKVFAAGLETSEETT